MFLRLKNFARRLRRRLRLYRQLARQTEHVLDQSVAIIEGADLPLPDTLPCGRPWPKISVITPSFNQGRYIRETIESVLRQGYPNVEHIIIDGGSSDDTMRVVEGYRGQLAHVVSERDRGQSDALNKGFKLATGEILCWLNSDDQFAPGALAAVAMAFANHESDLISGICEIYRDGELVHRHMSACIDGPLPLDDLLDLDNGWNAGQFFYQPEVFFTRSLWEKAGAHVREDCYYSMDYELWCRFAQVGARLHVIGAPLARFRLHPEQKTADPLKFKAELIHVRDSFRASHSISIQDSVRPPVRFERTLRVAMVNDVGMHHGAGIAHGRLAAGMDMAGHDLKLFDRRSMTNEDGVLDEVRLVASVKQFDPDVVVFGNLHAATRESVAVVDELGARYPTFWLTHDFWLITGRCAYPGPCRKYLAGCDADCPTARQYPDLTPEKIAPAWDAKRTLLSGDHPPYILANSGWSADLMLKAVSAVQGDAASRIRQIQLGAPVHLFRPLQKNAARHALGIKADHFVIAFSVSSLSEDRKGGRYLIEALQDLNLPNISVLLIGNQDAPFEINGVELVPLGYVTDTPTLAAALSAADIYVGPSLEETYGQVFIEAAMAGTPSIGFDLTGVRDAIIDGVTGLRVQPSVQSLRAAILDLHSNPKACKALGAWARIYAVNEFSLEASYHSLFSAWRGFGLIDRWGAPHKVGFVRPSAFVDERLQSVKPWRSVHGISGVEGPYPQFDLPNTFQWCHGGQSRVAVHCRDAGRYSVKMVYYCNLFESLELKLQINGAIAEPILIDRTSPQESGAVEFEINGLSGANYIDIFPAQTIEPTKDEPRALSFMLQKIDLKRI